MKPVSLPPLDFLGIVRPDFCFNLTVKLFFFQYFIIFCLGSFGHVLFSETFNWSRFAVKELLLLEVAVLIIEVEEKNMSTMIHELNPATFQQPDKKS